MRRGRCLHRPAPPHPPATLRRAGCPHPVAAAHHTAGRARGPCPTKHPSVGRDPCVPPTPALPIKNNVIAQPVTDVTGAAIRILFTLSRPYCPHRIRKGRWLPTVVPTDWRPLSWPPIGARPRNRLALPAIGGASAISPPPRGQGDGCCLLRKKRPPLRAVPLCVVKFEASQIQL